MTISCASLELHELSVWPGGGAFCRKFYCSLITSINQSIITSSALLTTERGDLLALNAVSFLQHLHVKYI